MTKNDFTSYFRNPKILIFLILILSILASMNGRMHEDEGIYSYVGRVWNQEGMAPYINTAENKTPGIFLVYAISNILFNTNILFIRGFGIIFICLTAILIYFIAKILHSKNAGILAMIIFGLIVSWRRFDGAYTTLTETYMAFFAISAFYILLIGMQKQKWKHWMIFAGSLLGFAIAFKQIAIFDTLALVIFFLIYNKRLLNTVSQIYGVLLILVGILIGTVISLIPLFISNVSLSEYINGAWLILFNSGSYATLTTRITYFLTVWCTSRVVIFYPFLFLWIFQLDIFKTRYFLGLFIWLFFDFIGVNSSGTYWGHQFKQMLPSLSIVIGILISNLLIKYISDEKILNKYLKRIIFVLIIIFFPNLQLINNLQWWTYDDRISHQKEIGLWVKENTNSDDYINLIGGGNPILAYSNRISSSKYFNSIYLTTENNISEFLSDLEEKTPELLIVSWSNIPSNIQEHIDNNYYYLLTKHNYKIYKKLL